MFLGRTHICIYMHAGLLRIVMVRNRLWEIVSTAQKLYRCPLTATEGCVHLYAGTVWAQLHNFPAGRWEQSSLLQCRLTLLSILYV